MYMCVCVCMVCVCVHVYGVTSAVCVCLRVLQPPDLLPNGIPLLLCGVLKTAAPLPRPSSPAPTSPPPTRWFGSPRPTRPLPLPPCCCGRAGAASSGWPACGAPNSGSSPPQSPGGARTLLRPRPRLAGTGRGSTGPLGTPPWGAHPHCHCHSRPSPGTWSEPDPSH